MAEPSWLVLSTGILALIILFGVLALWFTLRERKSGFPLSDERTRQLNGRAAYYAMWMCQYFILAYLMVTIVGREFLGMPAIEAGYPMIAALLVSCISYAAFRWYLDKNEEP